MVLQSCQPPQNLKHKQHSWLHGTSFEALAELELLPLGPSLVLGWRKNCNWGQDSRLLILLRLRNAEVEFISAQIASCFLSVEVCERVWFGWYRWHETLMRVRGGMDVYSIYSIRYS